VAVTWGSTASHVQLFRSFPYGNGTNGTYDLADQGQSILPGVVQIASYGVSYTDVNGYQQYGTVITPSATLAVDYSTLDWQVLRIDRNVPGDGVIHLPINNLDILDTNVDTQTRVLVVSLADPTQQLRISNIVFPGAALSTIAAPAVNVRDGIVYLPASWVNVPVRVYFAAYSTLAQQPLAAFRQYTASPDGINPGYRYYTFQQANNVAQLGFTISDIGKTVSMEYQYQYSAGGPMKNASTTAQIQGNTPVNPSSASASFTYPGVNGSASITSVSGISFQGRAVALETGDVRRADDPQLSVQPYEIWNPGQIGRLGEATEDVYVARS
jgi:hypothetical protein